MVKEKNVDEKLKEISVEVVKVGKKTNTLKITNEKEEIVATEMLGAIKGRLKEIEELRDFFVRPLNNQVGEINAKFKLQSEPLKESEIAIKRIISNYALEQSRIADEAQKKADEIRDKKLAKEQEKEDKKAEKEGREAEPVIDLAPAQVVERQANTIATSTGKTTKKKVWKHEILDVNDLPLKYRKEVLRVALEKGIVKTVITKFVQAGERDIKGVRIYEDIEISVTAK